MQTGRKRDVNARQLPVSADLQKGKRPFVYDVRYENGAVPGGSYLSGRPLPVTFNLDSYVFTSESAVPSKQYSTLIEI